MGASDVQVEQAGGEPPRRTLLFVSRQLLLAGTLAKMFVGPEEGWTVHVLDIGHENLLRQCLRIDPDVVVLDLDADVIPGLDLVSHLAAGLPKCAVLVLGEMTPSSTAEAIHRGAKGVLTYAATPTDVHDGVEAAAEGRTAIEPLALAGLIAGRRGADPAAGDAHLLSAREVDVLRLLVQGRPTRAVAADLGISVQTVRKHTQNILQKLGAHSKLQAAAIAVRDGLV